MTRYQVKANFIIAFILYPFPSVQRLEYPVAAQSVDRRIKAANPSFTWSINSWFGGLIDWLITRIFLLFFQPWWNQRQKPRVFWRSYQKETQPMSRKGGKVQTIVKNVVMKDVKWGKYMNIAGCKVDIISLYSGLITLCVLGYFKGAL